MATLLNSVKTEKLGLGMHIIYMSVILQSHSCKCKAFHVEGTTIFPASLEINRIYDFQSST